MDPRGSFSARIVDRHWLTGVLIVAVIAIIAVIGFVGFRLAPREALTTIGDAATTAAETVASDAAWFGRSRSRPAMPTV